MSEMKVFRFDVDEDYAKQHNELLRDTRYLVWSGIALFVLSVAAGIAVWFVVLPDSPWRVLGSLGLVLFGVMMLIVGLLIPRSVGSAQSLYSAHPLAPAVVAERGATDYTLLALVNGNVDPDAPPAWALTARTVRSLPHTDGVVGTKVPVAAVGGQRSIHDTSRWQMITPMPIAWGTADPAVVDAARAAVPRDQWHLLEKGRARLAEIKEAKNNLVFIG
ncbi:DUF3239 domain-containing protein [Corynebacterium sp. LK2510]|uniref:DUF3239 domain-containing protein n=1 Tax=Corynebacterium sp. LK2510 TaxID=3110472 RepID=UPI0034CFC34E